MSLLGYCTDIQGQEQPSVTSVGGIVPIAAACCADQNAAVMEYQ
jgi:hypothetical protein